MSEQPSSIIFDEEVERVHANANFGSMPKRQVINEGILRYALGYETGHTQLMILLEHRLIRKPKPGSYKSGLTEKGRRYIRSVYGAHFAQIAALASITP